MLAVLTERGASFASDIIAITRRLPSDVEEALWQLAAQGLITCDSLQPLRKRVSNRPDSHRSRPVNGTQPYARAALPAGRMPRRHSSRGRPVDPRRRESYSRWSLLEPLAPMTDGVELRVLQLLRRYGILFPELLARESMAPAWRDALPVLRRMEAQGEIRGGRFVTGFVGEQFAHPEAVDLLREVNRSAPTGSMVVISACDPLNLAGIITPGKKVPALSGNRLALCDGVPVASLESDGPVNLNGSRPAGTDPSLFVTAAA